MPPSTRTPTAACAWRSSTRTGARSTRSHSFVEHGTFHRRDEAASTRPNTKRYGTFDTYRRPGRPPWDGAVTTGLRDAIEQYTAIWFPGAWTANTPSRAAGRTRHTAPATTTSRSGARAR